MIPVALLGSSAPDSAFMRVTTHSRSSTSTSKWDSKMCMTEGATRTPMTPNVLWLASTSTSLSHAVITHVIATRQLNAPTTASVCWHTFFTVTFCTEKRGSLDTVSTNQTSNVTGRHRGLKWKLRVGYRAPSLNRTFYLSSSSVTDVIFFIVDMLRCVFIIDCGIMRFLCVMRVFEVQASSSSPRLLLRQFRFFRSFHCCGSSQRKIEYSITQSPGLFDALGTNTLLAIPTWHSLCCTKCQTQSLEASAPVVTHSVQCPDAGIQVLSVGLTQNSLKWIAC